MRTVAPVRLMPLLRRSSSTRPSSARSSAVRGPRRRLLRELLGPERLQSHLTFTSSAGRVPASRCSRTMISSRSRRWSWATSTGMRRAAGQQPLAERGGLAARLAAAIASRNAQVEPGMASGTSSSMSVAGDLAARR